MTHVNSSFADGYTYFYCNAYLQLFIRDILMSKDFYSQEAGSPHLEIRKPRYSLIAKSLLITGNGFRVRYMNIFNINFTNIISRMTYGYIIPL